VIVSALLAMGWVAWSVERRGEGVGGKELPPATP